MHFYLSLTQHPPCCCSQCNTSSQTLSWGDILLHFCKCKRQIQLSFEDVLCVVYMQAAHLQVVQLTENMQQGILQKEKGRVEDIKAKWSNVSAGKQSSTLTLSPSLSFSIYVFSSSCFSFFSLFANADCGVPSPLFSREIRLTCRGLKGICSAHQVCLALLFLWTAPPYNVKLKAQRIKTYCIVPILSVTAVTVRKHRWDSV